MIKPSYIGLIISGILIKISLYYIIKEYDKLDNKSIIYMLLLGGILVCVHTLIHCYLEFVDKFNPLDIMANNMDNLKYKIKNEKHDKNNL
jgi:hypothetical protein